MGESSNQKPELPSSERRKANSDVGSACTIEMTGRSCFEEANVKYTNMKMCSVSLITKEICFKELPLSVCHICIFIY